MSRMNTIKISEDGLPANGTMESLLETIHGLGEGNSLDTTTENMENSRSDELSDDNLEREDVAFQEYLSSKSKIEKVAVAHATDQSGIDLKQILLPTSVKRVSVPSALVQSAYEKIPPKSASILHASTASTKLQSSSMFQAGSTTLRATDSTRMTKAPNSTEKSFPNCTRYVIDTSIMNLKPVFVTPTDKKIEKSIKSALPKAESNVNKSETNVLRTDMEQSVGGEVGAEHSSAHKLTTSNTDDTANTPRLQVPHQPCALASFRPAFQNISGIELETAKLFTYLSKPYSYEFHTNKMLGAKSRIRNKDIPVDINVDMSSDCEMLAKGDISGTVLSAKTAGSNEHHTDKDCERLKEHTEDTAINISFNKNVDKKNARMAGNETKITEIINDDACIRKNDKEDANLEERSTNFEGVFDLSSFFQFCSKYDEKMNENDSDDVFDIASFFQLCSRMNETDDDAVDLASFFQLCSRMNEVDDDDVFDIASFFQLCSRMNEVDDDDVFDIASFFQLCSRMNKIDDDDVFDLASFFQLSSKMNEIDGDHVPDLASLFRLCTRDGDDMNKKDTYGVFDLGAFFKLYEHDEGMNKSDLDGVFLSNILELNGRKTNEILNTGHENDLEVIEDPGDTSSADLNDALMVDSFIRTEEDVETVEEQHLTETAASGIDGILDFGEDSLFGILGVFCRSDLHSWGN